MAHHPSPRTSPPGIGKTIARASSPPRSRGPGARPRLRGPLPDSAPGSAFVSAARPLSPVPAVAAAVAAGVLLAAAGPGELRAQEASGETAPVVRLGDEEREPGAELSEVFRVGRAMGEDWEQFARVADLAFDGSGRLYLLDAGPNRVLVFGPEGTFLRELGGAGGGPGELQSPSAIAVTTDGEVVVHDAGRRSLVVYGPDGEHRRDVSLDATEAFRLEGNRLEPDSTGGVLFVPFRLPGVDLAEGGIRRAEVEGSEDGEGDRRPPLLRLVPGNDARADTLALGPSSGEPSFRRSSSSGGRTRFAFSTGNEVFAPTLSWGPLPGGGAAVVDDTAYAVRIVDGSGRALRELRRDFGPRAVTGEIEEKMRERRRRSLEEGNFRIQSSGVPASVQRELRESLLQNVVEGMTFAEVVPPVQEIRTDPAGRIWVRRYGEDPSKAGPVDLLHAEGRYLATLPPEAWPDALGPDGRAAYVEEDDLGAERVVVRRLPAPLR